jgi:hypothetical protein
MRTIDLASLDLAQYIYPGDGVIFQQGCGEALSLGEAFVQQRAAYSGARVFFGSGFSRTFEPQHADHLRFSGIGGIGSLRKLASAGALDPIPCHISAIEGLIRAGTIRAEVVMLQVSPPNERGEYSFGLVNDYVRTAIDPVRASSWPRSTAKCPWSHCDRPLGPARSPSPSRPTARPLELPTAPFGDIERRIAAPPAGADPRPRDAAGGHRRGARGDRRELADRRDLGIHSGHDRRLGRRP